MGKATESQSKSLANRVGLILAIATVVLTAVNGIPPYLALRGKEPHVVYEFGRSEMLYPNDADRRAIRKLLSDNKIPDAFASLSLSNRGDIAAKDVVVTLSVPGEIVAEKTDPSIESRPAWVSITKEYNPKNDVSRIRYNLANLGLIRVFSARVSYISEPVGSARWDVYYDGKPGLMVDKLSAIPENARGISFAATFKVLGAGVLLTIIAYLSLRYRGAIRTSALLRGPRAAMALSGWRRYKNEVVFALATRGATLESVSDGSLDSADPRQFWDAVVRLGKVRAGIEVHTSAQQWPGLVGTVEEQTAYSLRLIAMSTHNSMPVDYVVVVNDVDLWAEDRPRQLVQMLHELFGHGQPNCLFVSGSAESAAQQILVQLVKNDTERA